MNCPKCQAEIGAAVKFCPECGQRIGTAIGLEGDVSLGGMRTVGGAVSLGQMPTQVGPAKPEGSRGLRIGERYEILAEIGRGGFAVVYRARDSKLGREVAAKRLQGPAVTGALGQQVLDRFAREGQTIAALNHRNIVMVYDHDRDQDGAYVVMEYVGGGSLRDLLKSKGGKLEVAEAVELVKGVARGLGYAHRKNLVHRDIKPANILLAKEGGELIPKIADFGLARLGTESELSLSGMGMGTPWYMPPEQRRNAKGVNHTADLYALGKTLYELVTGEVPDTVELEKLPAWLRPVIQRCIKNNPEERYFSAEELLKDLENPGAGASAAQGATAAHADQCPACGEINSAIEKYCQRCGAGLNQPCPECGREQRLKVRYCGGCGTDVPVFEKVTAVLVAMRRHAGELQHSRVLKDAEEFRQIQFSAKGAKGTQLVNDAASLGQAATEARQKQETELKAIEGLGQEGKFEEALKRLKALQSMSTDWGATEERLRKAIPAAWAVSLEQEARKLFAKKSLAEAWKQLALLESLTGKLDEPQTQLRDEVLALWVAAFQADFEALLRVGQYQAALQRLTEMNWVQGAAELAVTWSEAFGQRLEELQAAGKFRQAVAEGAFLEKVLAETPPLCDASEEDARQRKLAGLLREMEWPERLAAVKVAQAKRVKLSLLVGISALVATLAFGLGMWWWGVHLPAQRRIEEARIRAQQVARQAAETARLEAERKGEEEARLEAARLGAEEKVRQALASASPDNPWENSLGMKFVPVPGTKVLFSVWDTRVQDYEAYAGAAAGGDNSNPGLSHGQGPTDPVVNVNWGDAHAFCRWLTEKERKAGLITAEESYRLPTDAEWSMAVGLDEPSVGTPEEKDGKVKGVYPWGTQWPPPRGAGNYGKDLKVDDFPYMSPVGSFAPNRYGLYDMGGNVQQWCEDWYDDRKDSRVLRGASWYDHGPGDLLSSYRLYYTPDGRYGYVGFRCVMVVGSSP